MNFHELTEESIIYLNIFSPVFRRLSLTVDTMPGEEISRFFDKFPCELFLDLEKNDRHPDGERLARPRFRLPVKISARLLILHV